MNIKSNTKRAGGLPEFWPNNSASDIPIDFKDWVIAQYLNQQCMSIYCDASIKHNQNIIGVAFSVIANGSIQVKQQYIQPVQFPTSIPPIYAEMKSVIFALSHFEKYIGLCTEAIIYSDVNDIERILEDEPLFKKNPKLQDTRNELKLLYDNKQVTSKVKFSIEYLPVERKRYNPFYKSAHNAAYRLVKS
ncbi:hypothetical protein [Cytobacillus kochii]|uniref:hypothetical protein n=1 Tax=Cytobacillus kochii TaxID=859143 RepID=UPI0025A0B79B|nr:hypothetical protein [Cytobacillus kochii]MDM5209820.1 hypothetical protein [Cytobacillus kochii]